jgi:hypothetical protein
VRLVVVLLLCVTVQQARQQFPRTAIAAVALSLLFIFSEIGCGGSAAVSTSHLSPVQPAAATPAIQPVAGTYFAVQTISIADTTAGATIYYTTDGSTPTSASPTYSAPFSLNSATTVQALAVATGYSNSVIANARYEFRTPAATYPITVSVTATPAGSNKILQLNPIPLTLIVN